MQTLRTHLPLIVLGLVSTCVIFYLYRELQRTKADLAERCTGALCQESHGPAKRVRFADASEDGSSTEHHDLKAPAGPPTQGRRAPTTKSAATQQQAPRPQQPPAQPPQQPQAAPAATSPEPAFESSE